MECHALRGTARWGSFTDALNIYLHRLDAFVEDGSHAAIHPRSGRVQQSLRTRKVRTAIARGSRDADDRVAARSLRKQLRGLPSKDPRDPGYRRLRYCRYADDTLLGFTGPKAEAEEIKQRLAQFLRDELKLELTRRRH